MKTTIATLSLLISILGAPLTAADANPASGSVEQQIQKADVQLAIEQYKKLCMSAFDLTLKIQTDSTLTDDQRQQLETRCAQLQKQAEELRSVTLRKVAVALANGR